MPFVSGRDYRIQRGTFKHIYEKYKSYAATMKWKPLSKSYLRDLVHHDKVHRVTKPDFCAICMQNSKVKRSPEQIEEHKRVATEQKRVAMDQMRTLRPFDLLIVQDFTQIELSPTGSLQDLILVAYRRTESEGELERVYYHYVGEPGQKNDFHFVKGCWIDLLDNMTLYANSNLHIWSDGGRKHFKQSGHLRFWGELQQALKPMNITIQYNFYASYHGHNVCDAAASHSKSALKKYQLDFAFPVNDQNAVIDVLSSTPSSIVKPSISGLGKPPKVPTLKGISSYHCFEFPEPGKILAYRTSVPSSTSHIFTVKQ